MSEIDIKGLQDALEGLSGDDTVLLRHTVLRALLDRLESAERALALFVAYDNADVSGVHSMLAYVEALQAASTHIKKYGSNDHD